MTDYVDLREFPEGSRIFPEEDGVYVGPTRESAVRLPDEVVEVQRGGRGTSWRGAAQA